MFSMSQLQTKTYLNLKHADEKKKGQKQEKVKMDNVIVNKKTVVGNCTEKGQIWGESGRNTKLQQASGR